MQKPKKRGRNQPPKREQLPFDNPGGDDNGNDIVGDGDDDDDDDDDDNRDIGEGDDDNDGGCCGGGGDDDDDDDDNGVAASTLSPQSESLAAAVAAGQLPFPSVSDLNQRLRRIITAYQKLHKKELLRQEQREKVSRRVLFDENVYNFVKPSQRKERRLSARP